MASFLAPPVGLEPTTLRLTAACSTGWAKEEYLSWRLPIVPGRCQPSIVGTSELNFCVRDGNRWTLTVINTNYSIFPVSGSTIPVSIRNLMVTRAGIEPTLTAWEAAVLTAWPTGRLVHHQGLEPGTPWLRVRCSTNWANGAYCTLKTE